MTRGQVSLTSQDRVERVHRAYIRGTTCGQCGEVPRWMRAKNRDGEFTALAYRCSKCRNITYVSVTL